MLCNVHSAISSASLICNLNALVLVAPGRKGQNYIQNKEACILKIHLFEGYGGGKMRRSKNGLKSVYFPYVTVNTDRAVK
jgi:hypothetical protein